MKDIEQILKQGISASSEGVKHQKLCEALERMEQAGDGLPVTKKTAKDHIENALSNLIDTCACFPAECKDTDSRFWQTLMIYRPASPAPEQCVDGELYRLIKVEIGGDIPKGALVIGLDDGVVALVPALTHKPAQEPTDTLAGLLEKVPDKEISPRGRCVFTESYDHGFKKGWNARGNALTKALGDGG